MRQVFASLISSREQPFKERFPLLTLLHSEWPKLYGACAIGIKSAIGLNIKSNRVKEQ